jgi:GxxExxY protein
VTREQLDVIASRTLDCAFRVHQTLGPGLLESVYKVCLGIELANAGLYAQAEVPVAVVYAGQQVAEVGYRIDLLVEGALVVEVKSVEALHPVHHAQLLSYLRLADKRLGLLLNFNTALLKDGIKRIANRF